MTRTTVFVVSLSKMHFSLFPSVVAYCFVFILALPCVKTRAASQVRAFAFDLFDAHRTPTLQSPVKKRIPLNNVELNLLLAVLSLVLVSGCLTAALPAI